MNKLPYIVISPAKDEGERIGKTIESMISQTLLPVRWVIVDDGSSDNTFEVIKAYGRLHPWITGIRINRDTGRRIGSAEIRAFELGLQSVQRETFDLVVKLDCDLVLPRNYFEHLVDRFIADPQLGIASGVYLEQKGTVWKQIVMPSYHASGASKMIRATCLSEIGGFALVPGWDTADEVKAQTKGWKTGHFADLQFYHLRPEGAAIGNWKTDILHGHIYYVTGGGVLFLMLKSIHRIVFGRPVMLGGFALLWGYLKARLSGEQRLVTTVEAKFYRQQLNRRLLRVFREKVKFAGSSREEQRSA